MYIPSEYIGHQLLRLELSVKKKMNQTQNLVSIKTLKDLTDHHKYVFAINEFENIYSKIHKQPTFKYNEMIPSPHLMDINEFTLIYYINEVGMDNYLDLLQQEKDMGIITYRQLKLRKDKALELWNSYAKEHSNRCDLLDEMNRKVSDKIREVKNS